MAKSNVYYSDNTGTKLNIFEKSTKAGGNFYYIYLDKNLINESQIGALTTTMINIIPDAKVKTKKGKSAYQVSWSFTRATPIATEEIMFNSMFKYLNSIGYVDTYDTKNSKTSASGISKKQTITQSTTPQQKTEFAVGDEFTYITNTDNTIYKVTAIKDGQIYLSWTYPSGLKTEDWKWTTEQEGRQLIAEGKIIFINQPTSVPQNATNVSTKPKISNEEIDALKKELTDLIFLKDNTSDLEFEEKIELSTEISVIKRRIDDLYEKLFEQSVGDNEFFDRIFEQSFTPLKDRYNMEIKSNTSPEFISPSGEISDLDENMQRLVNSKEFKDWFGDWRNAFFYRNLEDLGGLNVSKVLTDKFEPLLVWHGTNNEFSYFKFEQFPANYFAKNREYSEFFATNKGGNGYVLPFFLSIKNPLDLSDFGYESVSSKDFFDWMYLNTGMTAEQLEVNPLFLDPTLQPLPIWMYIRNNPTMLQKLSDNKVFDGIKFYEYNPNLDPDRMRGYNPNVDDTIKNAYQTLAYIVFDPHQVKLADPERGEIMLASLKSFMLKRGGKI